MDRQGERQGGSVNEERYMERYVGRDMQGERQMGESEIKIEMEISRQRERLIRRQRDRFIDRDI